MTSASDNAPDLKALETLADGTARNALALRLAEAGRPGLPEVLIRMIARADLRANRGTLVHSLSYYDCSEHLNFLLGLVIDGGLEVASEAFGIIDLIDAVEGEEAEQALASTIEALARTDLLDWRRTMLDEILEMFE
ncbi:hypothetical protein BH10PSE4_BH10PSE4_30880 [soil metagenome]